MAPEEVAEEEARDEVVGEPEVETKTMARISSKTQEQRGELGVEGNTKIKGREWDPRLLWQMPIQLPVP